MPDPTSAAATGTPPLALGLVGLGKIARDQHLAAIAADPRIRLVATADPVHRAEGVPGYPDMTAMLAAHPDIAAVALCTPPAVRVGLARAALAHGCHVLLEKPPATAPTQLATLVAAAHTAARTLYAAWHSRESVVVDAARAWLAGRQVTGVQIVWAENICEWHPGQEWLLAAGGFGVFDPAINALSVLTAILPGAISVESAHLTVPAGRQAPIAATVGLTLGNGAPVTAELDFLRLGEPRWEITITTSGPTLTLARGGHVMLVDGVAQAESIDDEYARIYRRFDRLVADAQSDVDGLPLQLVADAMLLGHVTTGVPFAF